MRLLPMLAPMAQKIVRVDAHHQADRRRVCSDRIEVSAAVARGASERIDGALSRDSVRRRGSLASAKVQETSSSRSQAQTRQNNGGQCFGNSGGPIFLDGTSTLLTETSFGNSTALPATTSGLTRLTSKASSPAHCQARRESLDA
jgi:hypothetical protein